MKKLLFILLFTTHVNAAQKLNDFECEIIGYSAEFTMSLVQHGHDDTSEVLESRMEYAPYIVDYYQYIVEDARKATRLDPSEIDTAARTFNYKWQDICKRRNELYQKPLEIKK